jgi:hypothetical protein
MIVGDKHSSLFCQCSFEEGERNFIALTPAVLSVRTLACVKIKKEILYRIVTDTPA